MKIRTQSGQLVDITGKVTTTVRLPDGSFQILLHTKDKKEGDILGGYSTEAKAVHVLCGIQVAVRHPEKSMTRAERRRQAKMQEKCQVPLNLNLTVAQVAGMTGQQASILQTYLKRMEQQKTEAVTDAVIREAQEKLERAEDYITITNIIISLYAIKFSWGFTKANKKFLKNWKAAMDYVDRIGVAKAYELAHKEMDIDVEFEDLANYNIYEEMGFNRE